MPDTPAGRRLGAWSAAARVPHPSTGVKGRCEPPLRSGSRSACGRPLTPAPGCGGARSTKRRRASLRREAQAGIPTGALDDAATRWAHAVPAGPNESSLRSLRRDAVGRREGTALPSAVWTGPDAFSVDETADGGRDGDSQTPRRARLGPWAMISAPRCPDDNHPPLGGGRQWGAGSPDDGDSMSAATQHASFVGSSPPPRWTSDHKALSPRPATTERGVVTTMSERRPPSMLAIPRTAVTN